MDIKEMSKQCYQGLSFAPCHVMGLFQENIGKAEKVSCLIIVLLIQQESRSITFALTSKTIC